MNDKEIFKAVEDRIFNKTKTKKYETERSEKESDHKKEVKLLAVKFLLTTYLKEYCKNKPKKLKRMVGILEDLFNEAIEGFNDNYTFDYRLESFYYFLMIIHGKRKDMEYFFKRVEA